jgi:hypothetical protein
LQALEDYFRLGRRVMGRSILDGRLSKKPPSM